MRPIATTAASRAIADAPDVPLLSKSLPGIGSGSAWIGMFGPADLPGDIVERINREVDRIMRTPEMQERICRQRPHVHRR